MMFLTSSVIETETESANVTIVTESVTESVFAIAIVTEIAIGPCSCDEMKRGVGMRLSS